MHKLIIHKIFYIVLITIYLIGFFRINYVNADYAKDNGYLTEYYNPNSNILIIGDSRIRQMYLYGNKDASYVAVGAGSYYGDAERLGINSSDRKKTIKSYINKIVKKHGNCIAVVEATINEYNGKNDDTVPLNHLIDFAKEVSTYNSNVTVYVTSLIGQQNDDAVTSANIKAYNDKIKKKADSSDNLNYIDIKPDTVEYSPGDITHFNADTSKKIYDNIMGSVKNSKGKATTKNKKSSNSSSENIKRSNAKYKYDDTGSYIIDIPTHTTISQFKKNMKKLALFKSVKVETDGDDEDYIKTGDNVKVNKKTYTAIVLGDIDGDGKCTYKDILMEQWLYDNPDSDLNEYQKMRTKRRKSNGNSSGASSEEIVQTSVDVLESMLSTGRGMHYGTAGIWKDIEASAQSNSYVCATYVAVVLYESGALTEDQINAFNYHYTGAGGIPDMLEAAGWYQVSPEEAEPGDVINVYGYHVLIYAGGDDCYDETCAQDYNMSTPRNLWSAYKYDSRTQVWRAPEVTLKSTSDKLKKILESDAKDAASSAGGDWSVYASLIGKNEAAAYNDVKMQSASLIKLYIMGTVYEDYSNLKSKYGNLDSDLKSMITISDNNASNRLINLLGNGNSAAGRDKINDFCKKHGYSKTSIGRNLLEAPTNGDNYTSVTDCGKFLEEVYNKKLKGSENMLDLLKQQQIKTKIPAGLPSGVQSASKTGELSDVENDAAIVFADKPYILVVMSEKLSNTGTARSKIQGISKNVYNYFKDYKEETSNIKSAGNKTIVIDAGHQDHENSELEPVGPGATTSKMKVSGGTQGVATGIYEYELTLSLALKVGKILENKGYNVVQIRTSNNINISNSQRAEVANKLNADAFVRIHANGDQSQSKKGAMTICQTPSNPYNGNLYQKCRALSTYVLDELVAATGCVKEYVWETDTMSGINWAKVPVTIVEVGYMTNPEEDRMLATDEYRNKVSQGIVNGIIKYLEK